MSTKPFTLHGLYSDTLTFSISHISTSGLLQSVARGPPGSFLLYKFFTLVLLPGVDFHSLRIQPDPPRPLSTLSAHATMKKNSACRPLFLLFSLPSSSSAHKREFQDKLMDILGHPESGLRKMHRIL